MRNHVMPIVQRSSLAEALSARIAESAAVDGSIGVLAIEIFRIREINNTFGYKAGDDILEQTVGRLTALLRDGDQLYRTGGAEFVLITATLKNPAITTLAATKAQNLLQEPFQLDGQSIRVSSFIGIAASNDGAPTGEMLMQRADMALSRAKTTNTPFVVYEADQDNDAADAVFIENELKQGIEDDELLLVFQPKVNLMGAIVNGVEALARWHSPQRGPIFPSRFVPVAENSHLVMPFTVWTLNTALRHLRELRNQHLDLSMAINLSANIFHNSDIVDLIHHAIKLWESDPRAVVIEITESTMMINPQNSMRTLQSLCDLGLRISIDDFGTGYSSLSYLRRLPVNELKIDRGFVQDMVINKDDETIVRTVIDMAHNFGLTVTAEGVENEETLQRLMALGCDSAQGFHIAKPMPADELASWLAESRWKGVKK